MRPIPSALQDKLDSGLTTLARCFVLARRDGVVMGFTEHDEDIVLDAVICRAGSGLSASEARARLGLAVDGAEFAGALADDALSESDLAAGRYDAAAIAIWLVDWSEPELRVLIAKGTLGEVRREGAGVHRRAALAHRPPQPGERPALHRHLRGRPRRRALRHRSYRRGLSRQRGGRRTRRHLRVQRERAWRF